MKKFFMTTKKATVLDWNRDQHCGEEVEKEIEVLNIPKLIATVVIFVLVLIVAFTSFTVIPSGYTGVRTTFGQIDDAVVPNGFSWKIPIVQSISKVNNKQQSVIFKDKIWGESSERTVVYMEDVTVIFRINPEYSSWLYSHVNDYRTNAIPSSLLASAMKASMRELISSEVTNRSSVEPIAVKNLQDALNKNYNGNEVISVININIDNMDFEDSYNEAIATKQLAQLEKEKKDIENETAVNIENANAEKKRIAAQAEADQKVISAQAEAEAILAVAEAQAEANQKLSDSISDNLIKYEEVHAWDGKLPIISGSSSSMIINPADILGGADDD